MGARTRTMTCVGRWECTSPITAGRRTTRTAPVTSSEEKKAALSPDAPLGSVRDRTRTLTRDTCACVRLRLTRSPRVRQTWACDTDSPDEDSRRRRWFQALLTVKPLSNPKTQPPSRWSVSRRFLILRPRRRRRLQEMLSVTYGDTVDVRVTGEPPGRGAGRCPGPGRHSPCSGRRTGREGTGRPRSPALGWDTAAA